MIVEVEVVIHASRAAVWAAITDMVRAESILSGVEKSEVVHTPASGLIGLRWRETRMLFGKPATAEKWITEATEGESYKTRAESDGYVFWSTMRVTETGEGVRLTSVHVSEPQTFAARVMVIPMRLFFKGVAKKALLQDLNDFKHALERA